MANEELTVELELERDFQFRVRFGEGLDELLMDEPEPLGAGAGPNASRVLAAAIGNCLTASLLFCLRKAKQAPDGATTRAVVRMQRNQQGRLRVGGARVSIQLDFPAEQRDRMRRCMELFEDFCVVTQSVRNGLQVAVEVLDPEGQTLYRSDEESGA